MSTTLITRAEWGAKPSKRTLVPMTSNSGRYTVGHHSVTNITQAIYDPYQAVRDIQAAHLADKKNDYSDIAYNFLVSPTGLAFVGRGWNINGANGTGFNPAISNFNSTSICLLGNGDDPLCVTDEAKRTVDSLINDIESHFQYWTAVVGHRDKEYTHCPGDLYYPWLHGIHPDPTLIPPPPKESVKPMIDPPLHVDIVAYCAGPNGLGALLLGSDGGVFILDAPIYVPPGATVSPVGQSYWEGRSPADINMNVNGTYTVTATSGETYTYPDPAT